MSTIPGYGQEPPTEKAALQSLNEMMGGERAANTAWKNAVTGAGKASPVVPIEDLENVADQLTQSTDNLARVGGRSIKIRISTYKALNRKVGGA